MPSVNPMLFVIAVLAHLLATRLSGYFLPDQLYFSFSAFLFDTRDLNKPLAIVFKLMVPFAVSFGFVAALMGLRRLQTGLTGKTSELAHILERQIGVTLAFAAFSTALLMAWPYILLWDMLIAPELAQQRLTFLLAYFAYFFSNAYFALAGANTAKLMLAPRDPDKPFTLSTLSENKFTKPFMDLLAGSLTSAVAAFVASQAG